MMVFKELKGSYYEGSPFLPRFLSKHNNQYAKYMKEQGRTINLP